MGSKNFRDYLKIKFSKKKEIILSKWISNEGKHEFREIKNVGWKEYHNNVVHGSYNESTFNEIERAADYVILFTTNRGEANNFYLKITNVDIKWGFNKTNMNFLLNNGNWTMLNNKNDGNK